jgi:hypothetical protein
MNRRTPGSRWTGTWFLLRFLSLVGYRPCHMTYSLVHRWFPRITCKALEDQMDRRVWTGL